MSALDHFLLAELLATPTGAVQVRALASGLRQGRAVELAHGQAQGGTVRFVASARQRIATVVLPPAALALRLGPERALEARFEQWLGWLRAHGVLRLAALETGPQSLPPRWLPDPVVCACLGIVLNPVPGLARIAPLSVDAWLAAAPPASVAGLLRDAGMSTPFADWLQQVPAHAREPLQVPLLHMQESAAGPLHIGWYSLSHRDSPFSLGQASLLSVTPAGGILPALLPVDRGGAPWTERVDEPVESLDPAYRFIANPRLDRLFERVPALAEQLLAGAAFEATRAAADVAFVDDGQQHFARQIERLLAPKTASMTARLLQRAWPVAGAVPTLNRSRYLYGRSDRLIRQRRHEFAALVPELAMHVADSYCPETFQAVDQGRPLLPALAADLDVPVWAARRLLALLRQTPTLGADDVRHPDTLALYIAQCGAHAPEITPSELPLIEEIALLLHGVEDGPDTMATMRAAGREAALTGWDGVRALVDQHRNLDSPYMMLAFWDVMRSNVADVLERHGLVKAADDALVENVFAAWLRDVPLSEQLDMGNVWQALFWGHDPKVFAGVHVEAPRLFHAMTLVESRVEVTTLANFYELRTEAREMRHCIVSYHMAVVVGSVLTVSLRCQTTGERASASFALRPEGRWAATEVSGVGNAAVAANSQLPIAVQELLALLDDGTGLDPTALAFYRKPRSTAKRPVDFTVNGRCLVSQLPPALAGLAEQCFPGEGPLDRRILRAARRVMAVPRGNAAAPPQAGNANGQ